MSIAPDVGCFKVRSVRRLPDPQRADGDFVKALRGTPWNLNDQGQVEALPAFAPVAEQPAVDEEDLPAQPQEDDPVEDDDGLEDAITPLCTTDS